ncbi:MAG: AAA family ATPase, partial [Acidimicrobiales bacterium]
MTGGRPAGDPVAGDHLSGPFAPPAPLDPFDPRTALDATGILAQFNDLAVLSAADIHVARCLFELGAAGRGPTRGGSGDGAGAGWADDAVVLAAALAVRAPRLGHVCTDLAAARGTTITDSESPEEVRNLPWPPTEAWTSLVAASGLAANGDDDPAERPLRLCGALLYLDRYWRQECQVAADLEDRSRHPAAGVDLGVLAAGLDRLFPPLVAAPGLGAPPEPGPDLPRLAGAAAVVRRFSVIAGGPGTGKTTAVARVLALLGEQAEAAGAPLPRLALAAPTGKAAGRLEEAVHAEAATLAVSAQIRAQLLATSASTVHRLLGWRPGSHSRFRHHHGNRLPHDVVVVDETSMVSLSLMAKLVDAVRPDARLILVGDPEQLASIEAGAVLGDVVGPAAHGLRMGTRTRAALAEVTGREVPATEPASPTSVGDGIVVLRQVHRYGGGIAALAGAVQAGDEDAAVGLLASGAGDLRWIDADGAEAATEVRLGPVRA